MEENAREWKEQLAQDRRRWEEQMREDKQASEQRHEEFRTSLARVDRHIEAFNVRCGFSTERSFHEPTAAILEKSFGVKVINVNESDNEGTVFGRPEQVELDVVIHNGTLILIEIKSSIDKAGMYIFERKVRFYERCHGCTAQRLIVISPMIETRAREVGEQLGIELYADSVEVPVQPVRSP